jgi:hypothetical protein
MAIAICVDGLFLTRHFAGTGYLDYVLYGPESTVAPEGCGRVARQPLLGLMHARGGAPRRAVFDLLIGVCHEIFTGLVLSWKN